MATAVLPIGAPCVDCAGGGEINGLPCRGCGGKGRQPARVRAAARMWKTVHGWSLGAAGFAGSLVRGMPGIGGAAVFSVCTGGIAGHVFGHGLGPWVAGLVASVFALQIDRRL